VSKTNKKQPKKYEGPREVNDFIKFLAKESTDPLEGYLRDGSLKPKVAQTEPVESAEPVKSEIDRSEL
jgi:hypothetical protein